MAETTMARKGVVFSLASVLAIGGILFPSGTPPRKSPPHLLARTADEHAQMSAAYSKLPLSFEANRGQTDPRVKFLARVGHHAVYLTPTEAVLVLTTPKETPKDILPRRSGSPEQRDERTPTVLRTIFAGANPAPRITGLEELPGKANYFIGNDSAKWRTNVPTYARVRYHDLYPGIDLIYYGNQRQLEHDFVVNPGADPNRIMLDVQGAARVEVDTQGDLVLQTAVGQIRHRKPVIYQEVGGRRVDIPGGYVLKDGQRVGFAVATYDRNRPLVIDPVLSYPTNFGRRGIDVGRGIAVDSSGNAYVIGNTDSADFPTTRGAFQTALSGVQGVFVTKLNPTGSAPLVYSTYLGGSKIDVGRGIAVDTLGNAYVTGYTFSTNFPATPGAFQTTFPGGSISIFVTKLNPTGSVLMYSTYLGGSGEEEGLGIAVDSSGNVYATGYTTSTNFPTTPGAFQTTFGGGKDVFVTKINPTGSAPLVYSTYLGGNGDDQGYGIAVDSSGNAYVTGYTFSTDFPTTPGGFQTTFPGGRINVFMTKLNPTGSAPLYSTYLGGSGDDAGRGITVDSSGNAYVTGNTTSIDFPTTPGAFQTTKSGCRFCSDVFVTKLNLTSSAPLIYSTYLGGSGNNHAFGIAVDSSGNAYVIGTTSSTNFPTTPVAFQAANLGSGLDAAFVTKLNPTGSAPLVYSTFLGGSGDDQGYGIAVDNLGNAYVTGATSSTDFPTTPGAFQTVLSGNSYDAFMTKLNPTGSAPLYSTYLGGPGDDRGYGVADKQKKTPQIPQRRAFRK
jgi:hypothetical protein